MRSRTMAGNRGFTLIETVLALSITAVVLVVVLSALRLGITSWEKGESFIDASSERRAAAYRLEREAASIYPFRLKGAQGMTAFSGSQDRVGFVTVASGISSIPGARWVYYISDEDGLKIYEKHISADDPELVSFEGGELVDTEASIRKIDFKYLGEAGWSGDWDGKGLPRALKARLKLTDGSELEVLVQVRASMAGNAL